MKVLVSICDFGGRPTLESVKKCFDYENFTTRIFSTVDGDFVYPPSIGEDLPFQHRELFAKEIDKYDFFIFTENDIFYPKETIEFVLKNNNTFGEDLPIGLIREEEGHFIDFGALMHAPRKAIKINEDYFYCPNDHQASYFLTKNQLKRCIDSGNYLIEPCARNGYGKLETAASNVYFDCGLKKIFPIKNIPSLIVKHMDLKWKKCQPLYTIDHLYKDLNITTKHNA